MSVQLLTHKNALNIQCNQVNILDTVDSSDTLTGALHVNGGVSIGGNLKVGGSFTYSGDPIFNSDVSFLQHVFLYGTWDATNQGLGTLQVVGGTSIGESLRIGATHDSVDLTTGSLVVSAGGASIYRNLIIGGHQEILDTTSSTSNSTGALIVDGGVGIQTTLNVGNGTGATSTSTGTVVVNGGMGVSGRIYVGDSIYLKTTGGISAPLNYYSSETFSFAVGGALTSLNLTGCFTRIGAMCLMHINDLTGTSSGASSSIFTGAVVPARYLPDTGKYFTCCILNNSVLSASGYLYIRNDGVILIYNKDGANFSASGDCGIYSTGFTYFITT